MGMVPKGAKAMAASAVTLEPGVAGEPPPGEPGEGAAPVAAGVSTEMATATSTAATKDSTVGVSSVISGGAGAGGARVVVVVVVVWK